MTGITRAAAARVIAGYFHTTALHAGGIYDTYTVRDGQDRQWKLVRDTSIHCENRSGNPAGSTYSVEMVSPICVYEDIGAVQELIRKLREAGARVNDSCGIHVHVDASVHTAATLRNIVNIMAAKEDLLYKALQVNVSRENYCKKADTRFLDDVNRQRPRSMQELERLWYNGPSGREVIITTAPDTTPSTCTVCSLRALLNSGCSTPPSTLGRSRLISSSASPSATKRWSRNAHSRPGPIAAMRSTPSVPGCSGWG